MRGFLIINTRATCGHTPGGIFLSEADVPHPYANIVAALPDEAAILQGRLAMNSRLHGPLHEISPRSPAAALRRYSTRIACLVPIVLALVLGTAPAGAASLQVTSGILTGASGVIVNGQSYDVAFRDGTCIDLFGGCDQASDFVFQTQVDALSAAGALMSSVFLDTSLGLFDSVPGITRGCEISLLACSIRTPYAISTSDPSLFFNVRALNVFVESADLVQDVLTPRAFDSGGVDSTFAIWTRSVTAVPEPGQIALISICLLALASTRGKSRRNKES
jgi:hypothetical protein